MSHNWQHNNRGQEVPQVNTSDLENQEIKIQCKYRRDDAFLREGLEYLESSAVSLSAWSLIVDEYRHAKTKDGAKGKGNSPSATGYFILFCFTCSLSELDESHTLMAIFDANLLILANPFEQNT